MKAIVFVSVAFLLLCLVCGGCGASNEPTVTISELVSNPEQFNNQQVTIDGIYLNSWESTILTENVSFTPAGDEKELEAVGNAVWFSGFLSQDIRENLFQHTSPVAGPQRYGKLRVTGLFESGGKYGYLNSYKCRITVEKAELLEWTPPE